LVLPLITAHPKKLPFVPAGFDSLIFSEYSATTWQTC
jgi:hypothetical protein